MERCGAEGLESVRVTGMGLTRTEWIGGGGGVLLPVRSTVR